MKQDKSKYLFFDKNTLKNQLSVYGFAVFHEKVTEKFFKNYINSLGNKYFHRDSSPDGFSLIFNSQNKASGFKGFTNNALTFHTDRSCIKNTPKFMSIYFKKDVEEGGESNLVDIKEVVAFLKNNNPDMLRLLLHEKCLFFDERHKFESSIISITKDSVSVRYRNDEFISFPTKLKNVIPLWEKYLSQHQRTLKFKEGEFYILNNTRILHGRNKFEGERMIIRALFRNTSL